MSEYYIAALNQVPPKVFRETFQDLRIKEKYYLVPLFLFAKTYDKGRPPYQDFAKLVKTRNALVHYKEISSSIPAPHSDEEAVWAYNTACRMALKLLEFGPDDLRDRYQWATNELRFGNQGFLERNSKD